MERERERNRQRGSVKERGLPFICKVKAFVCQHGDVLFRQMCFLARPHGRSRLVRRCAWVPVCGCVCVSCVLRRGWGAPNSLFAAIWLIKTWKGPSGSRVLIVVIGVNKVPLHALITSIVSSRRANWAGLNTDGRRDARKREGGSGEEEGGLGSHTWHLFLCVSAMYPLSGPEKVIHWELPTNQ